MKLNCNLALTGGNWFKYNAGATTTGCRTTNQRKSSQTAGDFLQSANRQMNPRKSTSKIHRVMVLLAETE